MPQRSFSTAIVLASLLVGTPAIAAEETTPNGVLAPLQYPSTLSGMRISGIDRESSSDFTGQDASLSPRMEIRLGTAALGLGAALIFFLAGMKMSDIRSISGNSTAEVFYQGMGQVSFGMAAFTLFQLSLPGVLFTERAPTPSLQAK